jgi:hypothetical protein
MNSTNNRESSPNERLISNQRDKPRPFIVSGSVSYYTKSELEQMRGMGYKVEPALDLSKKIVSINMVPDSNVVCEICEDSTPEMQQDHGIHRGTVRIGYPDGTFRMTCSFHKPDQSEDSKPDYTDI